MKNENYEIEFMQKEIINLHEIIISKMQEINTLQFDLAIKQNKIEILQDMLNSKKYERK